MYFIRIYYAINFLDTQKVSNMEFMFYGCNSLKSIDIPNFKTQKEINMNCMFGKYPNDLKTEVKTKYKNLKKEAFND